MSEIEHQSTLPAVDNPEPRQRVRLVYEKGDAIKFISHQDEFRLWERTLRRADLPLLYKQGFNPQPHIQFTAPLGVGFTSVCEPLDIIFSPPVPVDELAARIRAKLPPGVVLHDLAEIPLRAEGLQSFLIGADYTILLYAKRGEIAPDLFTQRIEKFFQQTTLWRERERKGERYTYNLRPLVFELRYEGYDAAGEEHRIFLRVQARSGATGRPDEVVDALGLDTFARTLRRERLYFSDRPDDLAVFAAYPIIEQKTITGPRPKRPPVNRSAPAEAKPRAAGRSISERAGDEFV